MRDITRTVILSGIVFLFADEAGIAQAPATLPIDKRLTIAMTLDSPSNGVTMTPDGKRKFAVLVRSLADHPGPQVVEWKNGKTTPYPNAAWNSWTTGKDPATGFLHVNSMRFGPDGYLWVVDVGAPGFIPKVVPHGPKLVVIDVKTDKVVRTYALDSVAKPESLIDDIRFKGRTGYLTDAKEPGLIVINLDTGAARRLLDNDPSTTAQRPITGEGKLVLDADGKPVMIHTDQLEVSPDYKYFYYQPTVGPLYRIETRYLDDASLSNAQLSSHVEKFANTGGTGGTAIDAHGNIYISDTDKLCVSKITPAGKMTTLVCDPRMLWVDAMWIDASGTLWMPALQLENLAAFNHGKSRADMPFKVFTMPIGDGPSPVDHK